MKTCDEMLESVLCRAKKDIAKRNNIRKTALTIGTTGLCLMLILGLTLVPWSGEQPALPTDDHIAAPPTNQEIEPTETPVTQTTEPAQEEISDYAGQLYFLIGEEDTGILIPAQADMTFATESFFRFRSYKGMTDAEKYQASLEEIAFLTAFWEKYSGNGDGGWYSYSRSEEYFSMTLSGGVSSLVLPDASQIIDSKLETGGVFYVDKCIVKYEKTVTFGEGENVVTIPESSYRIHLHIRMGDETFKMIQENPDLKYSTLKDTITVTIRYKDGTKAVIKVDVTMNDEGYFFLSMRGNSNV